jgi:hypothetical protein
MDQHHIGKPDPDPHQSEKLDLDLDPDPHQSQKEDPNGQWTLTIEASRLKMEPWEVCRPVDSHYSDEKQDPDPEPYQCEADPQH